MKKRRKNHKYRQRKVATRKGRKAWKACKSKIWKGGKLESRKAERQKWKKDKRTNGNNEKLRTYDELRTCGKRTSRTRGSIEYFRFKNAEMKQCKHEEAIRNADRSKAEKQNSFDSSSFHFPTYPPFSHVRIWDVGKGGKEERRKGGNKAPGNIYI